MTLVKNPAGAAYRNPFWAFDTLFEDLPVWETRKPSVDIRETENSFVFEAELPGLAESEIDVQVENGVLTLSGPYQKQKKENADKKEPKAESAEKGTYLRKERRTSSFSRSFTLPRGVNTEEISANLKNGVLLITIPKKEEVKNHKISVK